MSFSVFSIVRTKLQYPRTDCTGELQDFRGLTAAQAWIKDTAGTETLTSAGYWSPSDSSTKTTDKTEVSYTLVVWNVATGTYVEADYPESEIETGYHAGVPISKRFGDPRTDANAANLVRLRT